MAVGLDLDQYQLKNRVLLVFAPSPRDARYEEQQAYLGAARGFGVRLLDLDGTEILRSSDPVAVRDLADVVSEKAERP